MPERADYQSATLIIRRPASAGTGGEPASESQNIVVWKLFLSSTIGDLKEYRNAVKDALYQYSQVACFLSETWLKTHQPAVQVCKDEIHVCAGYIGIFAYWYGSIPQGFSRSHTHLEYDWALEKWQTASKPPMMIFMPEPQSQAERDLREKAAQLIPTDQQQQAAHSELLSKFHEEVTRVRMVQSFKDQEDLCKWAITFGAQWNELRPLSAARGDLELVEKNAGTRKITDEQWGLLGRRQQLDTFDKILNHISLHPDVPAVAILAHGNEDAGQRFFLKKLVRNRRLRDGQPPRIGRPQFEQYGIQALVQWVGDSLGVPKGQEIGSITDLAQWIHNQLQTQQLCFVLNQVSRLAGGVTAFYRDIWQPLYTNLHQLRERQPATHRLIAILSDDKDATDLPGTVAVDWNTAFTAGDFAYLVKLPVLGEITTDDLLEWFEDLGVPENIMGQRQALVNVALNRAAGVDGTFSRVFDRLNQIELLPEGED